MLRIIPCTNEIYHVYNRGVEKRDIFTSKNEYSYFIHLLHTLNSSANLINTRRNFLTDRGPTSIKTRIHVPLVDICAFVLMPNHFHLLLKQHVETGISKFMQKISTGYTMFFNKKHDRSGALFQGKYKHAHITTDSQLLYIPHYIHLNPVDLIPKKQNLNTLTFLQNYKWSSLPDYLGLKNFPSITERKNILSLYKNNNNNNEYKKDFLEILKNRNIFFTHLNNNELIDHRY